MVAVAEVEVGATLQPPQILETQAVLVIHQHLVLYLFLPALRIAFALDLEET